jgi:hypothetical protein
VNEPNTRLIRIRWCVCCEEALPPRCVKCSKHPSCKPRLVRLVGVPEILKTAECGCCHLIRCQRPHCPNTRWLHLDSKEKARMGLKNFLCSRQCTVQMTADAKRTAVDVVCARPGCGQTRKVHLSALKASKHFVYCSQKCHFAHRVALNAARRRARLAERDGDDSVQALTCNGPRCRGVVRDHLKTSNARYQCTFCSTIRDAGISITKDLGLPNPAALKVMKAPLIEAGLKS